MDRPRDWGELEVRCQKSEVSRFAENRAIAHRYHPYRSADGKGTFGHATRLTFSHLTSDF